MRLPIFDWLRWPSWMRSEPRSGFAEISGLAIHPSAPCIDAATQFRLRTTEPENYTNGSVRDRGIHIVTQQSTIRTEITSWRLAGWPPAQEEANACRGDTSRG